MKWLFASSCASVKFGLLCIRVGIGLIFMLHGWPKIFSPQDWQWLGSQMVHMGITFWPMFWGFLAAWTEFFGGIALMCGFATRLFAALLAFVMFVAILYHINNGDSFKTYAQPLAFLFVFIGLCIAGAGYFSVDQQFFAQ